MCTSLLSRDSGFSEKHGASVHAAADENNWNSNSHPAQWPWGVVYKREEDDTDSASEPELRQAGPLHSAGRMSRYLDFCGEKADRWVLFALS